MRISALSPSKRLAAAAAAAAIIATGLVVSAPSTSANAAPFECTSDFFYVAANQLYSGNPATVGFATAIGAPNASGDYNAIGFNPVDGYIYGIGNTGAITGELVRIEHDGSVVSLGAPSGSALPTNVNAGAFADDGTFWVASGALLRRIDVVTNTATTPIVPSVSGLQSPDFVVHGANIIRLKSTSGLGGLTQITTIDTATGAFTATTGSTIPASVTSAVAMWLSVDERLFASTGGGQIYELIDWQTNTPSAQLRATMSITNAGDGAMCPLALSPFGIVAQDDDYSGTPLVASDGGVHGSIWANDTVDSAMATNSNVVTTILDEGGLVGVTIDTSGSIAVPGGFAPGTYFVDYQICSIAVPDECASATITILLIAGNSGPTLAATGGEAPQLIILGAATALLGGAALTLTSRRKNVY